MTLESLRAGHLEDTPQNRYALMVGAFEALLQTDESDPEQRDYTYRASLIGVLVVTEVHTSTPPAWLYNDTFNSGVMEAMRNTKKGVNLKEFPRRWSDNRWRKEYQEVIPSLRAPKELDFHSLDNFTLYQEIQNGHVVFEPERPLIKF